MPVGNRRSELEVIRDILQIGSSSTSSLRYSANMSYTQMQTYVQFLEISGLIELGRGENQKAFEVTPKGRRVLELIQELFQLMRPGNGDEPPAKCSRD